MRLQKLPNLTEVNDQMLDTMTWPLGDSLAVVEMPGINKKLLDSIISNSINTDGDNKLRGIRAIVVAFDGKIVAEGYAKGFDKHSKHNGWSMAKSLNNAFVGMLVK